MAAGHEKWADLSAEQQDAAQALGYDAKTWVTGGYVGVNLGIITLYQNEISQENMRLTAFFKLYKICILQSQNFRKNRFEKSTIFVGIQQNFANVANFANFCQVSKIFSLKIG